MMAEIFLIGSTIAMLAVFAVDAVQKNRGNSHRK